jgi:GH24 family phage-related lysozyme (muramidase)
VQMYSEPCSSGNLVGTLKKCDRINYKGTKQACNDGYCYAQTDTGWFRLNKCDSKTSTAAGDSTSACAATTKCKYVCAPAGIPQMAIDFLAQAESKKLSAYLDSVGVWTIGWGNTVMPDGKPVKKGDKLTDKQADDLFLKSITQKYWPCVARLPNFDRMTDGMRTSMLDFCYNLGANFYGIRPNFATITTVLQKGLWSEVPAAVYMYRNPGSSSEQGLGSRKISSGLAWNGMWKSGDPIYGRKLYATPPKVNLNTAPTFKNFPVRQN